MGHRTLDMLLYGSYASVETTARNENSRWRFIGLFTEVLEICTSQYSTNKQTQTHRQCGAHKDHCLRMSTLEDTGCRNFVLVNNLKTIIFSLFLQLVLWRRDIWLTVSSIEYQQDSLKAAIPIPIITYYWFEESKYVEVSEYSRAIPRKELVAMWKGRV
jgi:hypothetical protein